MVTGTVISSTAFNALTADLGTGLSTAITKDGQTVATAVIPFAAGMSSTTGVFTGKITATTAGIDVPTSALGTCYSGTYTPTLTNSTNVDGSTAAVCNYARIGNFVTVSGTLKIDPTIAGSMVLYMSLPVASNLTTVSQCAGTCNSLIAVEAVGIYGDVTNDRATFEGIAVNVTNHDFTFCFSYIVV